jgi:hypothetical protein
MDYKSAFTYVLQDPDWVKKILIAFLIAILSIFIIPAFFLGGYFIKTIRNVADGVEKPIPEWNNWGGFFVTGLKMMVVGFIYAIPCFIIMAALFGLFMLPVILGPDNAEPSMFFLILFEMSIFVFSAISYALMPSIIISFAQRERIADAVSPKKLISLVKSSPSDYVIVCLLAVALQTVASFGMIALIIGIFFTVIYAELVKANLFGQYIRLHLRPQNDLVLEAADADS